MKTAKLTALLTVFAALVFASSASAFSVTDFSTETSSAVAGGHPDLKVNMSFSTTPNGKGGRIADGNIKDIFFKLPPGFVGAPAAVPQCSQFGLVGNACPAGAQVGVANTALLFPNGATLTLPLPVYNMEVRNDHELAELGFSFSGLITVHLVISSRTDGDYGLDSDVTGILDALPVAQTTLTLWGVPGDPSHDGERTDQNLEPIPPQTWPRNPYLIAPTRCDGPLQWGLAVDSYQEPDTLQHYADTTPQQTGCDELEFAPKLTARPTTNAADSPSGLQFELKIPQNDDPDGTVPSQPRNIALTLPEGLVVNPSSANGLGVCTPQQIGLTSAVGNPNAAFDRAVPSCPDAAKLARAESDAPVVGDPPLKGAVYLASPGQNPFGSLLSLYLVLEGHGLVIKQAGKLTADPQTGRLTASFDENPQLPYERLAIDFNAGSLAPLRTPTTCGRYATTSVMSAWSAPETPAALPKDEYEITQGANGRPCGAPANAPSFEAGSTAPLAGSYKPFVVNLRREDGTQQFSAVTVSPPPGLVAKLASTATCSDAALAAAAANSGAVEQASPSCPAASAVGTVQAQAGAGPAPYNAPGTAYLGGPYKGAPLSLAIVTPAVAGPFDLGTIVVRVALGLDPKSAQVTAVSDPIPTILQGIPLDIRSVSIRLDKPDFTLNPTSCDPGTVGGSLLSTLGSTAPLQSRFQLAECGRLKFKPALSLSLKGASKRGGYPALTAVLKPRAGDANIAAVSVALPHSEFLAQEHIHTVCTRVQFAADACPAGSIYGKVTATSPLLDYPVSGPVYLRSSDHALPDLVLSLHGPASQPIRFEAAARIDSVKGGIRNTFEFVPDVPVTKLTLRMPGGKKGLLVNSRNICASGAGKADTDYSAHNGSVYEAQPQLRVRCGAKGKRSGPKRG